jgi:excisionase family DNA binding protein
MVRNGALGDATSIDAGTLPARAAGELAAALADEPTHGVILSFPDGRRVELPASMVEVVRRVARELSTGRAITVLPTDTTLTPAEVAKLLGLSRPFVVGLLDDGVIASERLPRSRHRRVRLTDVVAFAAQREQRRQGRRQIADAMADADLPY